MLSGHSIYHVEQNLGKHFSPNVIKGYYNDLTQKVIQGDRNLNAEGIPFLEHSDGSHVYMPTMIFQYGLGAYDMFLETDNRSYFESAVKCADWAVEKQKGNGAWNNFFYILFFSSIYKSFTWIKVKRCSLILSCNSLF